MFLQFFVACFETCSIRGVLDLVSAKDVTSNGQYSRPEVSYIPGRVKVEVV